MARNTLDAWLPEEFSSQVIIRVQQVSAIESWARRIPMNTTTLSTPRTAATSIQVIAKGGTYAEDTAANDQVILVVYKMGTAVRLAEEDLDDALADVIQAKKNDWSTAYAKFLDNACLATTVIANGTTVPYNSVYYSLSTTNAATGYTANANIIKTLTTVPLSYANLSNVLAILEASDFFDETRIGVIAHPTFKAMIRNIVDTQSRPIFVPANGLSMPDGASGTDVIFNYPIKWSNGAKLSATATSTPGGNAIAVFCNLDFLLLGVRSGPESVLIDGKDGASALTDETLLKLRARRAFAIANEQAFAIIQIVP
jgi:HK97 family phage major capsid protein